MKHGTWLGFGLLATLSACSGEEPARVAEFIPPADAQSRFGDLIVHYNALPTLTLGEAVAREYGVDRDAGKAMVLVAVRQARDGDEIPLAAQVSVSARDLSGKRQHVALREVVTGDYVDHVGVVDVSPRDTLRFDVVVDANGRKQTLQFQRGF